MDENDETKLQDLIRRVGQLSERQQQISKELLDVQHAIYNLKRGDIQKEVTPVAPQIEKKPEAPPKVTPPIRPTVEQTLQEISVEVKPLVKKEKAPLEDFIGTNLLNKIGIAVLVLGIGYGVKYSIDHELLSPLTRIILGYLAGGVLIFLALRLKQNYATFSAVLLSGGMASMYFITYAAYDFYGFFPQAVAFAIMVMFTAFTVFAALQYNLQVIAIIGLVGAYGVPFLLSDGSGRVVILFSYMCIINAGILILAFKKYWKELYYLAFILTWLIFDVWWFTNYNPNDHLASSLIFSTLFFLIFYLTFLAYKLFRKESFGGMDVAMLLLNSSIYFGFGYGSISGHQQGALYLGLFTVFNALLHFLVCLLVYKRKEEHKDIFYFVAGLVLVFITTAVPIQLDGSWVTLIWAAEAVLVFFIGRTRTIPTYEKLSYPLILSAVLSLLEDWSKFYDDTAVHNFILNNQFLTSFLVSSALAYILWLSFQKKYTPPFDPESARSRFFNFSLATFFLVTVYFMFYLEIESFWEQRYTNSLINVPATTDLVEYTTTDGDLQKFESLWLINYSAFFGLVVSIVTLRFFNYKNLVFASISYNTLVMAAFLVTSLSCLSDLRYNYLNHVDAHVFVRDAFHIVIRYICILFMLPLLWVNRKLIQKDHFAQELVNLEKIWLHFFAILLLSSELMHWLDLSHVENSDKITLSILWGVYALGMIVWGLSRQDRLVRILGIILFGITLVKLFVYDISNLSTIAKTIVMMTLGALLLVASFLYNRVKKKADNEA